MSKNERPRSPDDRAIRPLFRRNNWRTFFETSLVLVFFAMSFVLLPFCYSGVQRCCSLTYILHIQNGVSKITPFFSSISFAFTQARSESGGEHGQYVSLLLLAFRFVSIYEHFGFAFLSHSLACELRNTCYSRQQRIKDCVSFIHWQISDEPRTNIPRVWLEAIIIHTH